MVLRSLFVGFLIQTQIRLIIRKFITKINRKQTTQTQRGGAFSLKFCTDATPVSFNISRRLDMLVFPWSATGSKSFRQ